MNKVVRFDEISNKVLEQLPKGAFLTVKSGEIVNTMTIGWGSIGYLWRKPVFVVMVRQSRYTYGLMEDAKDFTVSVPLNGRLKEALNFCGTKSGKEINKIENAHLTLGESKNVKAPYIGECDVIIECKIVYKQAMDSAALDTEIVSKSYREGDLHTFYYGEILGCYLYE